jgi:hypothetical protein
MWGSETMSVADSSDGAATHHQSMTCRLNLPEIADQLAQVEFHWPAIDAALQQAGVGHKEPFTAFLRGNMLSAYAYLDEPLATHTPPFSPAGIDQMLALNERVHYGDSAALRAEFASAIDANADKFNLQIEPIAAWYWRHASRGEHPYKLAAEAYVSIVGQPQLFIEGNHRTGSLIASWINLWGGYAPFVLSQQNAVAYFAPSAAIKQFANRSTWRGRSQLPKYRKSFRAFWENHVDDKYVLRTSD